MQKLDTNKHSFFQRKFHSLSSRILGVFILMSFLILFVVGYGVSTALKSKIPTLMEDYIVRLVAELPQQDIQPIDLEELSQKTGFNFAIRKQDVTAYFTQSIQQPTWYQRLEPLFTHEDDWNHFRHHPDWLWDIERGHMMISVPYEGFELWIHYRLRQSSGQDQGGRIWLAVLIIILLTFWLIKRLLRPIQKIQQGAEQFAEGDFSQSIDLKGKGDLQTLGQTMNEMAQQIANRLENERELFGAMSHELRTPLARLKVAVEMVDNDPLKQTMGRAIKRMEGLIETLILRERSNGTVEVNDIYPLDDKVRAWLEQDIAEGLEKVEFRMTEQLAVKSDAFALRLIIKNLVENALKYGAEKPVRVGLAQKQDWIVMTFEDQGEGMSEDTINKIFQPFFRADQVRNLQTSGTGLGMYLVQAFVKRIQGKLEITSSLGQGSKITLQFPVKN